MENPIYILAGQSNARAIRDAMEQALELKYGAGGYRLVTVSAAGAPLTFKRQDRDWAAGDELRSDLMRETVAALAAEPGGKVAGIFWVQGEADTYDVARPDEYASRLSDLMTQYRADVAGYFPGRDTGVQKATLVLSGLSAFAPDAGSRSGWDAIRAAQSGFAGQSEFARLVDPDALASPDLIAQGGMFLDGLHYALAFRAMLAEALIDAAATGAQERADPSAAPKDEVISGTSGADIMAGGDGNDIYVVNDPDDRITEAEGQGVDGVIAQQSVWLNRLSDNLETLTLTGGGDIRGVGNRQDNLIYGNDGGNVLIGGRGDDIVFGGQGDDRLVAGPGRDQLYGGAGDDTYVIRKSGSRIFEGPDDGIDTVLSYVDFTLRFHSQNIENLTLMGDRAINATGNGLDNTLTGNDSANTLDGAWGDDRLFGGRGNDVLIGQRGDDLLRGGAGRDRFLFGEDHGQDVIADFETERDLLGFSGRIGLETLNIEQTGPDTLISYGDGNSITLLGVSAEALDTAQFFVF